MERENGSFKAGLGVGILSAIASVAATYYLFGTEDGSKKREKMKDYMLETKKKLLEEGDELKDSVQEVYKNLKITLKDKYEDLSNLSKEQKAELAERIKDRWEGVRDDIDEALEKSAINRISKEIKKDKEN